MTYYPCGTQGYYKRRVRALSEFGGGTEVSDSKTVRSLRFRYILGLSAIALLVTASWMTLQTVVAKQEHFAQLVNIAGHQRGHAERIALFAMGMKTTSGSDEYEYDVARAQLGRVINTLERNHKVLLEGDAERGIPRVMTPMLEIIYFDKSVGLDDAVTRYLDHARTIYETPFGELKANSAAYVFVMQYGPHVIKTLFDSAVDEYEAFGRDAIYEIQNLETMLWFGALATLLLELFLIFRPLERRVRKALADLEQKKADLEKTVIEMVAAKTELTASEEKFRAMAANVPGVIFQMVERRDGERGYVYVSPRCREIYGVSPDELQRDWEALSLHPDDRERFIKTIREAFENQTEWSFEGRVMTAEGVEKWCRGVSTPVPVNDDETVFNGVMIDITHQKKMEQQLRHLATTDPLTGAYNRRHFTQLAAAEFDRAVRHDHVFSVLMMDIDHFKRINDSHGHAGGDEALKKTVATVLTALRSSDFLGRFGGEEFCVLMPETGAAGARILGERIREQIAAMTVAWNGAEFGFTISIGVAEWREEDDSVEDALERADQSLYRAKSAGRNRVVLHEGEPGDAAEDGDGDQPAPALGGRNEHDPDPDGDRNHGYAASLPRAALPRSA